MMVYLIGILDDLFTLNRAFKWCLKISICAVFPFCSLLINNLYGFLGITELSFPASAALTFVVTLVIIESIKAVDDNDGLASSLALVFLSVIGYQFFTLGYYSYAFLDIALAGSLVVFIAYNVWGDVHFGTKIRMGNCGRLTLGFTLAYLSIKYMMDNRNVMVYRSDALLTSYSLLIVPIFNYISSTVKWMYFSADIKSIHDVRLQSYLRRCNISEKNVTALMTLMAICFFLLNKGLSHYNVSATMIVLADICIFTAIRIIVEHIGTNHKPQTQEETPDQTTLDRYAGNEGLVSVIMPTWNSAQFVAESIESILNQTYTNLELIITDDASADETPDILRHYADLDPRVRIILNTTNKGAGYSRNCSIKAANGQYIAFCDSDDRWDATKLQKQIHFMQEKDVDLCFCPYYTCNERNEYLGYIGVPKRVSLFQMMCDNKIGFLTAIYNTHNLGKHFMPTQRKRQDHALLLTLLRKCHHAYSLNEPLAHYRLHSGNMSANKIGLLRYNAQTYNSVFGWPKPLCWAFLFAFFIPSYFSKRLKNIIINISRTQLG